jgi:hypothetical protein
LRSAPFRVTSIQCVIHEQLAGKSLMKKRHSLTERIREINVKRETLSTIPTRAPADVAERLSLHHDILMHHTDNPGLSKYESDIAAALADMCLYVQWCRP